MITEISTVRPLALWAAGYAEDDWYLLPIHGLDTSGRCTCGKEGCSHPGKHPRTKHGVKDATCDPEQLERWWERWPDSNIGIDCGRSGLLVVDIDPDRDGDLEWARFVAVHPDAGLDETVKVKTGGGAT